MRVVVALCLLVLGCASGPTSVLVRVVDGDAGPAPGTLTVDVFDGFGRIAEATLSAPSLPGTLILRGLPDSDQVLRVVVRGGALLGGERVQTRAHAQVTIEVALHGSRLDTDGDGVPDDLDDCPSVPDPLQANAAGSGDGDACRADLGTPDLQPQPDLMPPPPSLCATLSPPVAFCDGFETGMLEAHWNMNHTQGQVSIGVDPTFSYRGTGSLKAHHDDLAAMGIDEVAVGETQSFPMSTFFVRAFMYVPSPQVAASQAIFFANQPSAPYHQISLEIDDQGLMTTYNNLASPSVYTQSLRKFPLDRWVCVEWEVIATASGASHLWIDGIEVPALAITQNLSGTPPIGLVELGLTVYQPPTAVPAHDVWFDEVIVDGARIGCTK